MSESGTCGAIVRPPRFLIALLAVGVAVDWGRAGLGHLPIASSWSAGVGAILVLGGGLLLSACMRQMREAGTHVPTVLPTNALVTCGPYKRSRNPIYIALLLIYGGLALLIRSPVALLLSPIAIVVLHFGVIRREERYLSALFGQVYADYCSTTRRWI